jgi:hypothetical protein
MINKELRGYRMTYQAKINLFAIKRFKQAFLIFLILGILIAFSAFFFYSPKAGIFSTRSCLFCLGVTGSLLGSFVFLIGITVSTFLLVPRGTS